MAYIFYSIVSREGTRAFIFSPEDDGFEAHLTDEVFDRLALLVEKAIEGQGYTITESSCEEAHVPISAAEMVMASVLARLRQQSVSQGYDSATERVGEASITRSFATIQQQGLLSKADLELLRSIAGGGKPTRFGHFDAI